MKIAVVLAGMSRTWRQCYVSMFDSLRGYEVETFVALNDRNRNRNDETIEELVSIDPEAVKNAYKPKSMKILNTAAIARQSLAQAATIRPKVCYGTQVYTASSVIAQIRCLREAVALVPDGEHDLVLKTRFDLYHDTPLVLEPWKGITSPFVVGPNGPACRKNVPFEDMCFWGSLEHIRSILDLVWKMLSDPALVKDHGEETLVTEFCYLDAMEQLGIPHRMLMDQRTSIVRK